MIQAPDGRLFLLTNHPQNNVLIYDPDGTLLSTWTLQMSGAHGLTFHEGHLYICDTSGRVVRATLDGQIVLEASEPGQRRPLQAE